MEPAKAVKEYKEELSAAQEQNEMLTKIVGKMTSGSPYFFSRSVFLRRENTRHSDIASSHLR
jgi:hypothetical protein